MMSAFAFFGAKNPSRSAGTHRMAQSFHGVYLRRMADIGHGCDAMK
jgi:hypothetical protein